MGEVVSGKFLLRWRDQLAGLVFTDDEVAAIGLPGEDLKVELGGATVSECDECGRVLGLSVEPGKHHPVAAMRSAMNSASRIVCEGLDNLDTLVVADTGKHVTFQSITLTLPKEVSDIIDEETAWAVFHRFWATPGGLTEDQDAQVREWSAPGFKQPYNEFTPDEIAERVAVSDATLEQKYPDDAKAKTEAKEQRLKRWKRDGLHPRVCEMVTRLGVSEERIVEARRAAAGKCLPGVAGWDSFKERNWGALACYHFWSSQAPLKRHLHFHVVVGMVGVEGEKLEANDYQCIGCGEQFTAFNVNLEHALCCSCQAGHDCGPASRLPDQIGADGRCLPENGALDRVDADRLRSSETMLEAERLRSYACKFTPGGSMLDHELVRKAWAKAIEEVTGYKFDWLEEKKPMEEQLDIHLEYNRLDQVDEEGVPIGRIKLLHTLKYNLRRWCADVGAAMLKAGPAGRAAYVQEPTGSENPAYRSACGTEMSLSEAWVDPCRARTFGWWNMLYEIVGRPVGDKEERCGICDGESAYKKTVALTQVDIAGCAWFVQSKKGRVEESRSPPGWFWRVLAAHGQGDRSGE